MNLRPHRQLISFVVIGASLCLGLSIGLIQPLRADVAQVRQQIDDEQRAIADDQRQRDTLPALKARLAQVQASLEAIKERSSAAATERDLYSAISTLAARHRITLEHLTPERARELQQPAAAPRPDPAAAPAHKDISVSYGMAVVATYPDLIAFLSDLEQNVGYALVRAVRIDPTPIENSKTLNATIQVEFYSFDVDVKIPQAPGAAAAIEDRT